MALGWPSQVKVVAHHQVQSVALYQLPGLDVLDDYLNH
jgi:hypothetical protein